MEKVPSPDVAGSEEAFFKKMKENIIYCDTSKEYETETKASETIGKVPLCGAILGIKIGRIDNFEPVGYFDPKIIVNNEYYSKRFERDYSDMLPYDLEHEMWEAYYAVKKGLNPDVMDLKEGVQNRHFGRSHYLAIRQALRMANKEGKLDEYLNWARIQMELFQTQGETEADRERARLL